MDWTCARLARSRGHCADGFRGVGVRPRPPSVLGIPSGHRAAGRTLCGIGGRRIAMEALCLPDTQTILSDAGLQTVRLPVDADGARVDRLAGAAALCTPSHQFPTGATLPPARRTVAVAWAGERGAVIVEDDHDGEFRYDRHPRQRRDRLVAAMAGCAPRVRVSGIAAGLHAVLELPAPGPSEDELAGRAEQRGLALAGLVLFGGAGPALVVGYGTPPEHPFAGALQRLCAVLDVQTAPECRCRSKSTRVRSCC